MSDGERLYAFYGGYDGCGGLWYLTRKPPHKDLEIEDEDGMTLKLQKASDEVATLVATKPLTDEKWVKFKVNKLMVFEGGEKVY